MARKRLPLLLSVLTGRVVAVKAETDGDLHIAPSDATGDKPRIVVVLMSNRTTIARWMTPTSFELQYMGSIRQLMGRSRVVLG